MMSDQSKSDNNSELLKRIRRGLTSQEKALEKQELMERAQSIFGSLNDDELSELDLKTADSTCSLTDFKIRVYSDWLELALAMTACVSFVTSFIYVNFVLR